MQVYIGGSIESWTVAGAFGQRRFVGLTILLVLGVATVWRLASAAAPFARYAFLAFAALAIWWNIAIMALFGAGLMDRQRIELNRNAYRCVLHVAPDGAAPRLSLLCRPRIVLPDVRAGGPMSDRVSALVLFASLVLVYNANGREMGNYDSQPTKFAARELLLRGTLALNYVVGATPQLAERPAFVVARDGRYRSAYSPVPAIAAAMIAWPLWKVGALDIRAPLGPNWIAKLSASILTAAAVALTFLMARRYLSPARAFALAVALGLGTGYWSTVSQTLWQHETTAFGLSLAVLAFTAPRLGTTHLAIVGIGLGLAGTSRPQLAPAVSIILAGVVARAGWRHALVPAAIAAAFGTALVAANVRWFGDPLGAMPILEALHPQVHATERSFHPTASGLAGLWLSPNRGLLCFSPIVIFAAGGTPLVLREGWQSAVRWCALAAAAQYVLYGSYAVWWGGHTFGPRYMLDVLPLLAPLAAAGIGGRPFRLAVTTASALLLAWSAAVAGTGAFVFPNERWNLHPRDVDRHHERLWDWSDTQIVRAWRSDPSPQNFSLFVRAPTP